MKNEFELAFNEVLEDKKLPKEVVMEALQAAMVSAYRRAVNASNAQQIDAVVDPETGVVRIYAEKEVVDSVEDQRTEVSLQDALQIDKDTDVGSMVTVDSTPNNFGRVAAQTARQVIQQRIRDAEREAQYNHFVLQVGEIVSGVIQAINQNGISLGLEMKAEGIMPRNQLIPGERFRVHDRVRALLLEVKSSPRGPQIILSRSHRNFLRRLLENEVPEIYNGMVEIRSIAREPGHRSKVAVSALQAGVDPVGACVGIRGVRIQAIVRELNEEKIDVIEWNPDAALYIAKALSPARVTGVYLNEYTKRAKTATVVVPEDQLSLAIGRVGQNARLAAKLTSWRIDIKSLPEAATDALHKLQSDSAFSALAEAEAEGLPQIEIILAKKTEGRPVTPEEYKVLTQFVDRVERGALQQLLEEKRAEEERLQIAKAGIPKMAFEIPLIEFEISKRVHGVISKASLDTVGDLMLQMNLDPDAIYALHGMGPKAMEELDVALEKVKQTAREQEEAERKAQAEAEAAEAIEISDEAEAVTDAEEVPVSDQVEGAEEISETEALIEPEGELAPAKVVEEPVPEEIEETAAAEVVEGEAEEPETLEEMFAVDVTQFEIEAEEGQEEDIEPGKKPKPKKKKRKFVEIEYDPDQDVMLVKKKRKRADEDWEEEW